MAIPSPITPPATLPPPSPLSPPHALNSGGGGGEYYSASESDDEDNTELTTANEADAEESVTSEGESLDGGPGGGVSVPESSLPSGSKRKEKWVAVKGKAGEHRPASPTVA